MKDKERMSDEEFCNQASELKMMLHADIKGYHPAIISCALSSLLFDLIETVKKHDEFMAQSLLEASIHVMTQDKKGEPEKWHLQ